MENRISSIKFAAGVRAFCWAWMAGALAACAGTEVVEQVSAIEEEVSPSVESSRRVGSARAQMKRTGLTSVDLTDPDATLDALRSSSQSYYVAPVLPAGGQGDPAYLGLAMYDEERDGRSGPADAEVRTCMEGLGYTFEDACPETGCPSDSHWIAFNALLDENEQRCETSNECIEIAIWTPNDTREGVRWDESAELVGEGVDLIAQAHEMGCLAETYPHFRGIVFDDFYWLNSVAQIAVGDDVLDVKGLCSPERLFLSEGVDQTGMPEHFVRFRGSPNEAACYGKSIAQAMYAAMKSAGERAELVPWIYPRQTGALIADGVVFGSRRGHVRGIDSGGTGGGAR